MREAVYEEMIRRLRAMRTNEDQPIFEAHELDLLQLASALADAVAYGYMDQREASRRFLQKIDSYRPKEGVVKF